MKKEHVLTGVVVFGVLLYILNYKKSTLDSAKVESNTQDSFSFDGIDTSVQEIESKNIFKSKARFNLK